MHGSMLDTLPAPPTGKSGWPWTEETPQLPDTMPDGSAWPRVSVVTPSYNQGEFIEETIRSVLLQGYPNLEYIIIDGGSDDGTINVIRKYERNLSYWLSESDDGQSDALNKGFKRTTGTVLTWLNSDDRLQPGAIQAAVKFFQEHSDVGVVYGDYNIIDSASNLLGRYQSPDFEFTHQIVRQLITQPAAFFRRAVWDRVGPLDVNLHYMMDRDLWTRAALYFPIAHISTLMADVRFHDSAKTVAQTINFMLEERHFFDKFFALPDLPPQIRALESQARGANYFAAGREYLKNNRRKEAHCAFKQAWRTYPMHYNKLIILPLWLDTVLQTNIGLPLFHLVARLKNPGQFSG